jgi:hypothetical protein
MEPQGALRLSFKGLIGVCAEHTGSRAALAANFREQFGVR